MSQHESTEKPPQQQQNVRVVPIFVEGRDEPVINKDFVDAGPTSSSSQVPPQPHHHHHQMPEPPRMSDFGSDFGPRMDGAKGSSIFDRVKNFPVTNTFRDFFRDSESPVRNVPMNHHNMPEAKVHSYQRQASPQPQQAPTNQPPHERTRTFSSSSAGSAPSNQPQTATDCEQQQPKVPPPTKKEETPPPQQPPKKAAPLDPITKIQTIQKDVLDLMNKVEQFEGKTKKDKDFLYLEEMLTQNLLKLDTVDTDGKENVKLARKEAVKCINRCLAVLEAKAEVAESNPPSKTSSAGSMYDNQGSMYNNQGSVESNQEAAATSALPSCKVSEPQAEPATSQWDAKGRYFKHLFKKSSTKS